MVWNGLLALALVSSPSHALGQGTVVESRASADYNLAELLEGKKSLFHEVDEEKFRKGVLSDSVVPGLSGEEREAIFKNVVRMMNSYPLLDIPQDANVNLKPCGSEHVDEIRKLVFEDVIKEKLKLKINNTYDLIVAVNEAVEYLSEYNYSMLLESLGIGWDVNEDGRFDGVEGGWLEWVDRETRRLLRTDPERGVERVLEETRRIDSSPPEELLLSKGGEKDGVRWVCRNYVEALYMLWDVAKKIYPDLTHDIEFVALFEPGHAYGAFINGRTLEYMVVDPTWRDSWSQKWAGGNKRKGIGFSEGHHPDFKKDGYFEYGEILRVLFTIHDARGRETLENAEKLVARFKRKYGKSPLSTPLLFFLAEAEGRVGNTEKAKGMLKGIVCSKEEFEGLNEAMKSKILYTLGNLHREQGNYGEAIDLYKRCIEASPDLEYFADDAYVELARVYTESGNLIEAMSMAENILRTFPERTRFRNYYAEGKAILCHVQARLGVNSMAHNLYFLQRYEDALERFKAMSLEDEEGRDEALFWEARCYENMGMEEKAKKIYDALMNSKNDKVREWSETSLRMMQEEMLRKATIYLSHGKYEDGFEILRKLEKMGYNVSIEW